MSEMLNSKKILFLGSTPNIAGMVKTAQHMGLYTIVTDNKPYDKAPAKRIADEYADISLADIDAVVAFIKEKHIDGVLTGFSDSYLQYYLAICEKAGLPCYGSTTSFGIATDKMLFKQACQAFGVGTIPGGNVYKFDEAVKMAARLGYPLILKPADNSGSRGVIRCESADGLKNAFEYALSFSPSKNVICEKFMTCDGIGVSYQLINGQAYLSSTCDRYNYIAKADGSSITGGLTYPSKYTDRYIKEMDKKVQTMLSHSGFSDGMVSLQSFFDDNGFYMCEMCYRPSGGHHYILIGDQNGLNGLEFLIEYAVSGTIAKYDSKNETPYFNDLCAMIRIIGKPNEKIALCKGFDLVGSIDGIIEISQALDAGDKIGKDGTTEQVLASIWCKAIDMESLRKLKNKIEDCLEIENTNRESLIWRIPYFG